MLGNFFRRSAKHKHRLNNKRNVEIDNVVSSGGQGKYMKYVSFLCLRLRQHYQFLTLEFSRLKTIV